MDIPFPSLVRKLSVAAPLSVVTLTASPRHRRLARPSTPPSLAALQFEARSSSCPQLSLRSILFRVEGPLGDARFRNPQLLRARFASPQCAIEIGSFSLRLIWLFIHFIISTWFFVLGLAGAVDSCLISSGLLKKYNDLNLGKLRYLAIVVDSDEARQTSKVIKLLQWLSDIGVKHVCLYDEEGVLKKSKDAILEKLDHIRLFKETDEIIPLDKKNMTLELASPSDGKEAVARAANLLFSKHLELRNTTEDQEEDIFTEAHMTEALRAVGCSGPDPDLLLVYGPARCHLGFPPWRLRYTEIVHMGPLKSMKNGSLMKAIYKFTLVRQNYGK